ncbi:hypothetical protein N7530_004016 [Penicillium desertorum]|uniref:Uncharacterized protein n=1 Tax=Penicillium desertorum TaxID=1303715 RepID=A0A9X0BQD4_9EURO|nr:hypothetical protein N7530_004016 [Penicillium desertorum]
MTVTPPSTTVTILHRHLAVGYLPTNIDLVCAVTTITLCVSVVFRTFYSVKPALIFLDAVLSFIHSQPHFLFFRRGFHLGQNHPNIPQKKLKTTENPYLL